MPNVKTKLFVCEYQLSSPKVHTNFTNKLKRLVLTDEFYLFTKHRTSNSQRFSFSTDIELQN